jgi:hypothetical protein
MYLRTSGGARRWTLSACPRLSIAASVWRREALWAAHSHAPQPLAMPRQVALGLLPAQTPCLGAVQPFDVGLLVER